MEVRRADPRDAHGIAVVHVRTWQAAYRDLVPDEQLARLDVEKCSVAWESALEDASWPAYVLDDRGVVRGFCSAGQCADPDKDGRRTAEIPAIYVDPGFWGRGHGRTLCEAVIAELSQRGFSEVVLWALPGNERAGRFYRALGFVTDGAEKRHPRIDKQLIRYRRDLDPGT
jgi:ribosomal protein S18 acetylase RimI-like enzyme